MEKWIAIKGYEGIYEISSYGNVKSIGRTINAHRYTYYKNGGFMSPNIAPNGYYYVHLSNNGIRRTHYIHQLVANAFIIKPDDILEVDHIDENKLNNHVDNLRWVTRFFNASRSTKGMFRRGPTNGENNPRAKKVYCYKDNDLIKVYGCAVSLAEELEVHRSYVRKRLRKSGLVYNGLNYYYEPLPI